MYTQLGISGLRKDPGLGNEETAWVTANSSPDFRRPSGKELERRGRHLAELRENWGEAYDFSYEAGRYVATRRDNGTGVRDPEFEGIRQKVRDDYRANPVPRVVGPRPARDHGPCPG
jgi:hypothetical protein